MENILKKLYIWQEVSNQNRTPKLGKGFLTATRFNPYNPLSYIVLIMILLGGFIVGAITFWKDYLKTHYANPFKWE